MTFWGGAVTFWGGAVTFWGGAVTFWGGAPLFPSNLRAYHIHQFTQSLLLKCWIDNDQDCTCNLLITRRELSYPTTNVLKLNFKSYGQSNWDIFFKLHIFNDSRLVLLSINFINYITSVVFKTRLSGRLMRWFLIK